MNDLLSAELKNIDSQNVRRIVLTAPVKTSEYRKITGKNTVINKVLKKLFL